MQTCVYLPRARVSISGGVQCAEHTGGDAAPSGRRGAGLASDDLVNKASVLIVFVFHLSLVSFALEMLGGN